MSILEKSSRVLEKGLNLNTRSVIFLACLGLSSVFWLLTVLSKPYTEKISIPVNYSDLPQDKVLFSKLPAELALQVKASGFKILLFRISGLDKPLEIKASPESLKRLPSADAGKYALVTGKNIDRISEELNDGFELIGVYPDTIFFDFRERMEKQLPVKFKGSLTYDHQFGPVGIITFNPGSVTVSGPAEILDTLKAVYTNVLELNDLDEKVATTVNLTPNEKGLPLTITPPTAEMKLNVEKYTEGSVTVRLQRDGSMDNFKLFPAEVKLRYQVPLSQFDLVTPNQFSAEVISDDINKGSTNSLKVHISDYPSSVMRVRAEPSAVEYIIQK